LVTSQKRIGGLGIRQALAADHDALLHDVARLLPRPGRGQQQDFRGRRQPARRCVIRRHALIDKAEGHLRGLAEQRLDPLGILKAGELDQDLVGPLALDRRLAGACLVDAAADDLDRLLDGVLRDLFQRGVGIGGDDLAIGRDREIHVLGDGLQDRACLLDIVLVPEGQLYRMAVDAKAGIADIGLAQLGAEAVDDARQPLAHHRFHVGLQQQMRAALEVEPEADPQMRQKARDSIVDAGRQKVGQGEDASQHQHGQDQNHLPSRKIHHER
jgi:hypothetical protein